MTLRSRVAALALCCAVILRAQITPEQTEFFEKKIRPAFSAIHTVVRGLTLSFDAMAPILLVHGWHEYPSLWGPSPSSAAACGIDPKPGANDGGFNFIQPLIDVRAPFDCQLTINPKFNNADGAAALRTLVIQKAQAFGASHVHLVGHSKGGLWIREMLTSFSDANVGIYSVTNISTPNYGSPMGDMLVGAHQYPLTAGNIFISGLRGLISFIRNVTGGYDEGADGLQVSQAVKNNRRMGAPPDETSVNGVPNKVKYYYVPADADTNHNGFIDRANQLGDEGFPFGKQWANIIGVSRTRIADGQYQFLKNIAQVNWRPGHAPVYVTEGATFKTTWRFRCTVWDTRSSLIW
jgi:triacylglycerol esterase/lipase EstA (alpha/beta hydrolase family)